MKFRASSLKDLLLVALLLGGAGMLIRFEGSSAPSRNERADHSEMRASLRLQPSAALAPKPSEKLRRKARVSRFVTERTQPGLTLYPEVGSAQILLLDLDGTILHSWPIDADRARLLPDCSLLVMHGSKWGRERLPWSELKPVVREYNFQGEVVWEYAVRGLPHHDIRRLQNGNTLILYSRKLPYDQVRDKLDPILPGQEVIADSLIEISETGKPLWEWHAKDHLDMNYCGREKCPHHRPQYLKQRGKRLKPLDWTHINSVQPLPQNRFFEQGDLRFRPENLLLMARNWSTAFIIDKQSGSKIWEFGGDYKGGIGRGHEAQMIPPQLPGAGNILIFDNGNRQQRHGGRSFGLEVNPKSEKLEWVYDRGTQFFSHARGSIQRLANGNTLLAEDQRGRVLEVTPSGETVWEYRGGYQSSRPQRYSYELCPQLMRKEKG